MAKQQTQVSADDRNNECQAQHTQLQKEQKRVRRKHGLIQFAAIFVLLIIIVALFMLSIVYKLPAYDGILLGESILAFAIGIVCSHAYNYEPGWEKPGSLRDQAAKKQAIWLHANFCWQIISAWMTITPLYCTCATIYISGISSGDEWDQVHVLIYSILSLVLSLGIYVICPSNRAAGYRDAHLSVSEILANPKSDDDAVSRAIIKGEQIIAQQHKTDLK